MLAVAFEIRPSLAQTRVRGGPGVGIQSLPRGTQGLTVSRVNRV